MKKRTKTAAVSAAAAFGAKLASDFNNPASMGSTAGKLPPPPSPSKPINPTTPLTSVPGPSFGGSPAQQFGAATARAGSSAPKPLAATPAYSTVVSSPSQPQSAAVSPAAIDANLSPLERELKLRQGAIDAEQARTSARERLQYGDWWGGKNKSQLGRGFGENVAYPLVTGAADLSNRVYLTGKNMALRGAGLGAAINAGIGQYGKWLGAPWNAPKPLTSAEQLDYKNLQGILTRGDRNLTPEELARSTEFDKRQRAFEAERERQESWDAYSGRSINDLDKMVETGHETTRMIEEGIAPNAPRAQIATSPDGQQYVNVENQDPIQKLQGELTDAAGQDSLASRVGNVSYGLGDFAMHQVPTALATAGVGAGMSGLGKVLPYGRTFFQTGGQMLNPTMGQILPNTTARIGAGIGAGIGVYNAADDIANANTREEQIAAGQGLGQNMQTGMFLGGLAGSAVPGAARLYERAMYPSATSAAQQAAAQASPTMVATIPAAGAVPAAAPGFGSTAGTFGVQLGASTAGGVIEGAQAADAARNDFVTQQVVPDEQIFVEQQQQLAANDPTGVGSVNVDMIPPVFRSAASRGNAGLGTGMVGSSAVLRPGETENEFQVVPTLQDRDFIDRYFQESGAYRTPDGKMGTVEPQALQAGQTAFDKTLAETGSRAQADQAREAAYADTYVQSYRAEQRGMYDTSREEFEKMLGAENPDSEALSGQFAKSLTHLARSNPEAAEDTKNYIQWAEQKLSGEEPPNPQAQAFEDKARDTYVAAAETANPTPPAAQNDPQAFGASKRGLLESFEALPTEAKAAIGIGLPLALVGLLMNSSEDGGMGGILLSVLGLGAAGLGAAGGGLLGDDAQQMVGGGVRSIANMFGAKIPEGEQDLSLLLEQDPAAAVMKSGRGTNFDVESIKTRLAQADQLRQLMKMPSFVAVPLLRSLDPKNIRTAQQAQQAYDNAQRLVREMDDTNSPLAQMMSSGQDMVNLKSQVDGFFGG